MGPILLLSVLAGAIGIFFIVVKTTESNKAAVSSKDAQVTAPTASQEAKESRRKASTKKKGITGPAADVPSLENLESLESNGSSKVQTTVPSSETKQNVQVLNVKTDSTPVFQSNSTNSTQVASLQKGDEVRSGGLEIIDSQTTWTLVRGRGRSGFVRSESLERKTPTEEAQK